MSPRWSLGNASTLSCAFRLASAASRFAFSKAACSSGVISPSAFASFNLSWAAWSAFLAALTANCASSRCLSTSSLTPFASESFTSGTSIPFNFSKSDGIFPRWSLGNASTLPCAFSFASTASWFAFSKASCSSGVISPSAFASFNLS